LDPSSLTEGLNGIVCSFSFFFVSCSINQTDLCFAFLDVVEQEKKLGLLWSAKTVLYKCAVQIQGELQPLHDCKARGERLGTVLKEKVFEALGRRKKTVQRVLKLFCDRRADYLQTHAPDQLSKPENKEITYEEFRNLQLDDPFWNDGFMCLSKDPWAVDPTVRTGIHALLRLDRANEELEQLSNELQRCLWWGVNYRNQLKHRIDQCILGTSSLAYSCGLVGDLQRFLNQSGTLDSDLSATLINTFGSLSFEVRKIVSDALESAQTEHEYLLLTWHTVVEEILVLGMVSSNDFPKEWMALVEFLKTYNVTNTAETDVDLLLEETVLNNQDTDGESGNEKENNQDIEHVVPDNDDD
jgi:hypothetical protein